MSNLELIVERENIENEKQLGRTQVKLEDQQSHYSPKGMKMELG